MEIHRYPRKLFFRFNAGFAVGCLGRRLRQDPRQFDDTAVKSVTADGQESTSIAIGFRQPAAKASVIAVDIFANQLRRIGVLPILSVLEFVLNRGVANSSLRKSQSDGLVSNHYWLTNYYFLGSLKYGF